MKIKAALWILAVLSGYGSALAGERVALAQVSHIHGIAVDPMDSERLFLATHYGLFRASQDGTAERISETGHDLMGFVADPKNPKVFYASGHPQGGGNLGVLRSADGGVTWKQLARGVKGPVDFHAMAISKGNPSVIYGVHGGLQVSRDGGNNWEIAGPAPEGVIGLAAGAKNSNLLYAATRSGLLISRDGGQTWKSAYASKAPATMVSTGADGTVYAYLFPHGLMRSEEGSANWSKLAALPGISVMLHFAAAKDAFFAVSQDGSILKSPDGGRTWQPMAVK
ncbi:MAG: hypothetical protein OEL53_07195 [Rhodospirillales bacterium]|nr:hypothetical protein [Rhodospirillales bacterium]